MSRFGSIAAAIALFAATLVGSSSTLSAQTTAPAGDAAHGKQLFDVNGCYLCHNYQGQGTGSRRPAQNPGPNLAPGPIPWVAFVKQLRTPRVAMPPYDAHLLSDKDLADIYAYLASQPPSKDPHSIALLESVNTGASSSAGAGSASSSPLAHGAEVFAANCAACHGASGGGGVGPSLKNEGTRKDTAAAIAFIKNPPPAMPKLYPSVLKDADVAAVAAYVESLH
jgi:ubiquinol-cytochrome c reductase cytochrome c subunit